MGSYAVVELQFLHLKEEISGKEEKDEDMMFITT